MLNPPPSISNEIQRIVTVAVGGAGFTDLTADEVTNEFIREDPEGFTEEELELLLEDGDAPDQPRSENQVLASDGGRNEPLH